MKGSVLFVENDFGTINLVDKLLSEKGYLVLPFKDGQDAIDSVENGLKYDIACIDLELPHRGGDEVIYVSKKVNPDAPVICISGYSFKPTGANYFLDKQYLNIKNLIKIFDRCLK